MADFIKKTSQAGGSKGKETYIYHKARFGDKEDKKEEKKPESKYLKKKDKNISIYIKKVPKEDKKEDKKPEYIKKKRKLLHNKRTGESVKVALAGGGAAQRGLGRAFLKGGKV